MYVDLTGRHSGETKAVIINGASSSVGAYAVQLAKRAGLFVIGVAGSSKDYAKSLGVDVLIDYRDHKGEALVCSQRRLAFSYGLLTWIWTR